MGILGLKHVTWAPGYDSNTHPGGPATFTDEEWIDAFYRSYSVWVLNPAENLVTDKDAGFAILLLIYPYFEMITRHNKGRKPKKKEYFEFFRDGILSVFQAELGAQPESIQNSVAKLLYENLRSDLAHGNLTGKGIALSDDNKPSIWWSIDTDGNANAVGVNPRLWTERVRHHFEAYRSILLDSNQATNRESFLKYAKRNIAP